MKCSSSSNAIIPFSSYKTSKKIWVAEGFEPRTHGPEEDAFAGKANSPHCQSNTLLLHLVLPLLALAAAGLLLPLGICNSPILLLLLLELAWFG